MARRGEQLREHILRTAKDVFLESGYERTSMDVVAQRAETSKRSLYAHFPSKNDLFAGVVALSRELYLEQLGLPDPSLVDPVDAVVRYCGRLLQLLLWTTSLRSLRMGIAEAERAPELASGYYEAVFEVPTGRLATFIEQRTDLGAGPARAAAEDLVVRTVYPELMGCLFGVRPSLPDRPSDTALADDVDLDTLRESVERILSRPVERRRTRSAPEEIQGEVLSPAKRS